VLKDVEVIPVPEGFPCIIILHGIDHNYLYARFAIGKNPDRRWNEMTPTTEVKE